MEWKRHENNIYYKIMEWFQVISKVSNQKMCTTWTRQESC